MKRTDAIVEMRSLLGVRFRHQGRNPATGLDCVGFGLQYAKLLGRPMVDRKAYSRDPDGSLRQSICHVMGEPIAEGKGCAAVAQEGDAVMMEFTPGVPRHVAMVTQIGGVLHVIHADSNVGCVVEHRLTPDWAAKIVAVWRPEA